MTLTIELSDQATAHIQAAAEARGQDVGTFAIDAVIAAADEGTDSNAGPDMEIVAAAIESVDDTRDGRLFTLEEADARFELDYAEARARVRAQIRAGVSPVAHRNV